MSNEQINFTMERNNLLLETLILLKAQINNTIEQIIIIKSSFAIIVLSCTNFTGDSITFKKHYIGKIYIYKCFFS